MINHKAGFYLGVFIFVIPFLGFPTIWKMGLVLFGGLFLILMSIRIPVPKRMLKYKPKKETFVPDMEKNEKKEEVVIPVIDPIKIEVIDPRQKTVIPTRKTRKVSTKIDSTIRVDKQ